MTRFVSRGFLFIVTASFGYALLPVFTNNLYDVSDFGALDIAIWRFLVAVPIIWVLIWFRQSPTSPTRIARWKLLGMGVFYAGAALSAFWGLQLIPASIYVVLFFTYPAMVTVISMIFGRKISGIVWLALAMTLVGILITVGDFQGLQGADATGIAVALLNAFIVALLFFISNRVLRGDTRIIRSTGWMITGALIVLLIMLIFTRNLAFPQNVETVLNLIGLAILSTIMPIFLVNSGIQLVGAPKAAIISSIEPVFSLSLAVIFLGEVIFPIQWVGAALIVGSVVLLELNSLRKANITAKISSDSII